MLDKIYLLWTCLDKGFRYTLSATMGPLVALVSAAI
jgi:hypothetical protein